MGVNLRLGLRHDPEIKICGDFRKFISVDQCALLDYVFKTPYAVSRYGCGTANKRNIRRYLCVQSASTNMHNYTAVARETGHDTTILGLVKIKICLIVQL